MILSISLKALASSAFAFVSIFHLNKFNVLDNIAV